MTTEEFGARKILEGRRVRISFTDGQEVLATLIDVSVDLDGSQHLLYDDVLWSALPHVDVGRGAFYAGGSELVSISEAEEHHA